MALMTSSSSSFPSCSTNPQWSTEWKYDVFLSFRGEDTRKGFTDHLYVALEREGLFTFRDDEELERGKPISTKLLQAIQESRIAIVVFSRNYASSRWCLDELVKIVECMKGMRQTVLPIFYDVDPSDVRNQTGEFGNAFGDHEERFKNNLEKVERWRAALTEVANLSGYPLQNRYQSEFLQEIVEKIRSDFDSTLSIVSKDLVGIGLRVEEMMGLCLGIEEEDDVGFIGIWGMGGIGKTTLARAFYEKVRSQFQASSYVNNVREVSAKSGGLVSLQEQLLSDVQMTSITSKGDVHMGISKIQQRLCHRKVLIVLDDVDKLEQLQALAGSTNWFGRGSRIIITTRDEQLLIAHGVEKRHKARELKDDEALKLFSRKAFKDNHPPKDYMEVSQDFVKYAKGLPLAIEVVVPFLSGKSIIEWKSSLNRLKGNLDREIMRVLLMGFDGLHEKEQQIFLDIACFFKGEDRDRVTKILESFGFDPIISIGVLIRKSLITVRGRTLWMHDLLQEMGWEIVRQECAKEPGKRSRLWHYDDVLDVMKYDKGTDAVEGMVLKFYQEENVQLNSHAFSMMKRLRFLRVSNVLLPHGLKYLSTELRYIEWHGYPSKLLPKSFPSGKLAELNMCRSHITHLWMGIKPLDNLKSIDLSGSENLIETPNFTGVPNLEILILEGCKKLSKVHPSIAILRRLTLLNLKNCKSLKSISDNIWLESLETFILSGCAQLKRFPEIVGGMECLSKLYLDGTAIKELPLSVNRLTGLTLLDLSDCRNLSRLPNAICSLIWLKKITLSGCSKLSNIPDSLESLESLEELDASRTAITQMPLFIVYLKNLKKLSYSNCTSQLSKSLIFPAVCPKVSLSLPSSFSGLCYLTDLDLSYGNLFDGAIPDDLDRLYSLRNMFLRGNKFASMPKTFCRLNKLIQLSVRDCTKLQALPELPTSTMFVWAEGCTSLRSDADQYEVWPSTEEGQLRIIKRSISPATFIQINDFQFVSWLQRCHEVEGGPPLRMAHGFSAANITPEWFTIQSSSSSITVQLPAQIDDKAKPWIGYAMYVSFLVHESFDTSCGFKVKHKFDCYLHTNEGPLRKETLYHELNVKDVPFTGSNGYWIIVPHLWFIKQLNHLNECTNIEACTSTDSAAVEVKMYGARLLYEHDFFGFLQAIKTSCRLRITSINKENSSESRLTIREQGESISLIQCLEFLPLQCYEGRLGSGGKSYYIKGNLNDAQTATDFGEILQQCSNELFQYDNWFAQHEIPKWFCRVNGCSASFPLNPSLDYMKDWKGIAICAAFTIRRDSSRLQDTLDMEKFDSVECYLSRTGTSWGKRMRFNIPKSENPLVLKRHGIWLSYSSRGSFPDFILNGCTSMKATFYSTSQDIMVRNCGYQLVFHDNVEGFAEMIMKCSTTSQSEPKDEEELSNSTPSTRLCSMFQSLFLIFFVVSLALFCKYCLPLAKTK